MPPADGTPTFPATQRSRCRLRRGRKRRSSAVIGFRNVSKDRDRSRVRRLAGAGLVLPLAVGALVTGGAGTSAASPGTGPTAVVSMGDSYISGEAGRWKGNTLTNTGSRNGTDRGWVSGSTYDPGKVYGTTAAWVSPLRLRRSAQRRGDRRRRREPGLLRGDFRQRVPRLQRRRRLQGRGTAGGSARRGGRQPQRQGHRPVHRRERPGLRRHHQGLRARLRHLELVLLRRPAVRGRPEDRRGHGQRRQVRGRGAGRDARGRVRRLLVPDRAAVLPVADPAGRGEPVHPERLEPASTRAAAPSGTATRTGRGTRSCRR